MSHVLIVDDDSSIRDSVQALLEDAGYDVSQADNGLTALEMLRATREPLIVLLDEQMPKMKGTELLDIVARSDTLVKRNAFILFTASSLPLIASWHIPLSVAVVLKPFDADVLLEVIAHTPLAEIAPSVPDTASLNAATSREEFSGAWRTEREIDVERQRFLAARRTLSGEKGLYPFADITPRLSRADIEWLLMTLESGGLRGPITWSEPRQRGRSGLDLRGTQLGRLNLKGLPLGGTILRGAHLEEVHLDGVHLEGADLGEAILKHLRGAQLDGANLVRATLTGCDLQEASLQGAFLEGAHLEGARLASSLLQGAGMYGVLARGCDFRNAQLRGAYLTNADVRRAHFEGADLRHAILHNVRLDGAYLIGANLRGANLSGAHLKAADLSGARMEQAIIAGAHAEQSNLSNVVLTGTDLRRIAFDAGTVLDGVVMSEPGVQGSRIADIQWGHVNLTVVDWEHVAVLGDTQVAQRMNDPDKSGAPTNHHESQLSGLVTAVRANRQLATALRSQGINEDADRFAYQAQMLQQRVLWRRSKWGQWFFALVLDTLAGYGFRLRRILLAYGIALAIFAAIYYGLGLAQGGHLAWYQACLVSLTAIHGRVFFEQFGLNSILSWVAAIESVVGIVIEGVFVAMLVQRFFAR